MAHREPTHLYDIRLRAVPYTLEAPGIQGKEKTVIMLSEQEHDLPWADPPGRGYPVCMFVEEYGQH
jgi:hypothetical protein